MGHWRSPVIEVKRILGHTVSDIGQLIGPPIRYELRENRAVRSYKVMEMIIEVGFRDQVAVSTSCDLQALKLTDVKTALALVRLLTPLTPSTKIAPSANVLCWDPYWEGSPAITEELLI